MSLRYFVPRTASRPEVQSFGLLDEDQAAFNQRLLLPEARHTVFLNLGAPLLWERGRASITLPAAFLAAARTRPLRLRSSGPCQALGIQLAPWGARLALAETARLDGEPIAPLGPEWRALAGWVRRTL